MHKNLKFELEEGEILFDALDNQGEKLPHGCLAGSCGACRIEITEGAENLKPASAIERDTIEAISENYEKRNGPGSLEARTIRLSCRARVLGDVSIKPLK
ncbi:MAG: (2Fe-2S)-binding protein [Bacteriovoracaceae bacterium]|nr:(2Fe-2S)-binding protein [Bacteriovoracaceae bacterium]